MESYQDKAQQQLLDTIREDFYVSKGDRIAQFLLELIVSPQVLLVTELPGTNLGSKGFDSTVMAVIEACGRVVVTPPVTSDGRIAEISMRVENS